MLSELNIEKYRGIDSLKLEDLGRVNVIAGEKIIRAKQVFWRL